MLTRRDVFSNTQPESSASEEGGNKELADDVTAVLVNQYVLGRTKM